MTDPLAVDSAARYAGTYRSPEGETLLLEASGDSLLLLQGDRRTALVPQGEDAFLGPAPAFALFPLRFERDSTGSDRRGHGGRWYIGERYRGPRVFRYPRPGMAYVGHYRIMQPWEPNFRIILRRGTLCVGRPRGRRGTADAARRRRVPGGGAVVGRAALFDAVVDGQALRAASQG